ncbi:MAG: MFS transporter [Deltaproteobacteria bacterium]|nr:MFS transporter [Deltaproteobacteria bacterium]
MIATVLIGALGYFVDIYDLLLFSIVRTASLRDLGVAPSESLTVGLSLLSWQMWGLLLGGLVWGVLGDKRGRVSVLFGSILLYSTANIANAFVHTLGQYEFWRFVAGVGLAGELGAAITLVSETLPAKYRGYGTAVVAGVGLFGAVLAAYVGKNYSWRTAFIIGGVLGFALLLTRVSMLESGMFGRLRDEGVKRGDLAMLFLSPPRLFRLLRCVLIGLPIWFVVGILVTGAPEFARAFHVTGEVTGASAVQWTYLGLVLGDLGSGVLSQWVGSRRKVVLWFLVLTTGLVVAYLAQSGGTSTQLYALCSAMGFGIGYWAVFVTIAAEQFGTNLRATVTTSVPNFVRGSVPLLTAAFIGLKGQGMSLVGSAMVVGGACLTLALASLWWMEETYGRELDYLE